MSNIVLCYCTGDGIREKKGEIRRVQGRYFVLGLFSNMQRNSKMLC